MRQVKLRDELYAIIVSPDDFTDGINFVSAAEWPFQLGLLMHKSGHTIAPHRHTAQPGRVIAQTQEFLLVVSGTMEVDFFDVDGQWFDTQRLTSGEALLHIQGGHGFRFMEKTRVLELKQGPYLGKDKEKEMIGTVSQGYHSS